MEKALYSAVLNPVMKGKPHGLRFRQLYGHQFSSAFSDPESPGNGPGLSGDDLGG